MSTSATLEATEKALVEIEGRLDTALEAADEAVAVVVNNPVVLAGVAVVGLTAGGYVGYLVAKKHLASKFDADLEEEIDKTRTFYRSLSKEGTTPEDLVAAKNLPVELGYSVETPVQSESDLIETETSIAAGREEAIEQPMPEPREERSIFSGTVGEWDQGAEMMRRDQNPDDPYIISKHEYVANEYERDQASWTYFEGDDTLADEREMPIMDIEGTVGEDNLTKFGYGSEDRNIVYVHSPKSGIDIEVMRSVGKYAEEVAGLSHSDDDGRIRKFRGFDE